MNNGFALKNKKQTYVDHNRKQRILRSLKKNWLLYLFILPFAVYVVMFSYIPMYGLQIAFRNYTYSGGITGSAWAGMKWFERFWNSPRFWPIMKNTFALGVYSLVASFPLPIILAIILNNVKNLKWKKFAQTITYMPHFISTVVIVGMMSLFFDPNSGFVNTLIEIFGGSGDTYFMGEPQYFSHMYVWSGVWREMGWSSIIYLAALAGVDPGLHDAAKIDGANKFQRVIHVDIPTILPTVIIMLIMKCGSIVSIGYEKVYLMQNSLNINAAEVISTYVYKIGLENHQYSFASAIGLFNNLINFILLIIVNKTADKISGSSLW